MCPLHHESRRRHETGSGKRGEETARQGRGRQGRARTALESSVSPYGLEYPQEGESSFPKWFYEYVPVYDFLADVKSASLALAPVCTTYFARKNIYDANLRIQSIRSNNFIERIPSR